MKDEFWMVLSGAVGLGLFLIANLTTFMESMNVLAGMLQLGANGFVFWAWGRAFLRAKSFKKIVAGTGAIVPLIMATITIVRVLLPALW